MKLIDEFNPDGFVPKISGKAGLLCNPVAKTLPTGKVYGITNPAAHLVCFPITATGTQQTPNVVVTNQFGHATLTPARQPNSLCVPSWKSLTGPLNKSPNTPPRLSHFTCYPVSVAGGAYKPPSGLKLRDEFSKAKVAVTVNPVPQELCLPAKKIAGGHTYPIVNPVPHLLCFGVSKTPIRNPVWAQNQFGRTKMAVRATQWLCLPSTLDIPPAVLSTTPSNGATGVATDSTIDINFSEPVHASAGAFSLECPTGTSKAFALSSSPDASFTLTPTSPLHLGTTCKVTVHASGITDVDAGTPLAADYVFSFTTRELKVTGTTPSNGATGVATDSTIQINFSDPVNASAGAFTLECPAGTPKAFALSSSPAASFTLTPTSPLPMSTTCKVTVHASGITEVNTGSPLGADYVFSLTTCGVKCHVYWINYGRNYFEGTVNKAPLVGGSVTTLAINQDLPESLAVDGTHVYWLNYGNGKVNKVPLGGGSVTTLATDNLNVVSVAVDGTSVYWANYLDGTVNKVPLGGGSVTTLASGQHYPSALAVDGTYVYFTNSGDDAQKNGTVNKVPLGGGSVTTLASGQDLPKSIAVDGTSVYWDNVGTHAGDGSVNKVPLGGGSVTTLVPGGEPLSVAVDGTYVYWADPGSVPGTGTVNKVPLGGGSVTTLASGQGFPSSVVVDGTHVYWVSYDDGTVNKVPLGGGSVTTLAKGQNAPAALALGP